MLAKIQKGKIEEIFGFLIKVLTDQENKFKSKRQNSKLIKL